MRVLFPRHINQWLFSTMSFTIWPLTVTLPQLLLLAIGLVGTFFIGNSLIQNGFGKWVSMALASPCLIIFVAIAFFEVSEMNLLSFISKMIQNHFLDVTEKFQVQYAGDDAITTLIAKSKIQKKTTTFTSKAKSF